MHAELDGLGTKALDAVRQALVRRARVRRASNILADTTGDNQVTIDDVGVTTTNDQVQFNLELAQTLATVNVPLDFDLGLPAVGLEVNGGVQLADWATTITSVSASTAKTSISTRRVPNELVVQAVASLPNTSATGRLGPLELTAVDDPVHPSAFDAMFTVDFVDPFDSSNKITLSELESSSFDPSSIVQATFNASANVNLDLVLGFGSDAIFPSISSTFSLAWSFTNTPTDANATSFGNAPQIAFDDVRINLGEFFSKFAAPILNEVKQLTDPIQPLIDFLHQRVPLISDLIGQTITWLDIANDLSRFHSSSVAEDLRYINATVALIDLLNHIPTDVDNIFIQLGSFDLAGTDVRSLSDLSGIELTDSQITPPARVADRADCRQFAVGSRFFQ